MIRLFYEMPRRLLKALFRKTLGIYFWRGWWKTTLAPNEIKSILIINTNRLGDVVLTEPMARTIRQHFVNAEFTLFVDETLVEFSKLLFNTNKVIGINPHVSSIIANHTYYRSLKFDLIVSPFYNLKQVILSIFIDAKAYVGYFTEKGMGGGFHSSNNLDIINLPYKPITVSLNKHSHISNWPKSVLTGLFGEANEYHPRITIQSLDARVKKEIKSVFHNLPGTLIALHIGSRWKYRRWPIESVVKFANSYSNRDNVHIVFLGDESDREEFVKIGPQVTAKKINFVGKLSIIETCFVISQCSVFIGPDSGLLHCSAALNVPSVGLYGPNLPEVSAPISDNAKILFHRMPCCPCDQVICDQGENRCMKKISVDTVINTAQDLLMQTHK
jgi:ADP-heptose:LPS heptosyltransferase